MQRRWLLDLLSRAAIAWTRQTLLRAFAPRRA
jgi:hypothetical protein